MRKMDCPTSLLYDKKHMFLRTTCHFRHNFYLWDGVCDNKVGLISDSISKWIREVKHLHVQAIPGLTLEDALQKMSQGYLKTTGFEAIILFLGTNSLGERPMVVARQMLAIVRFLQHNSPDTKLGICRIIPRPGDLRKNIEENRQKVNEHYKAICKRNRLVHLDSYKGVCSRGSFDQTLYAFDLIHLNWDGIMSMREYLRGAAATMLEGSGKAKNMK
jgi:lysophospholipase L1-like esterase